MQAEMRKVVSTPHRNRATFASDAKSPLKTGDSQNVKIKLVCGSTHFTFPMEAKMTKAQALKEAKKRWSGLDCNPCVRDRRSPSSQEQRDAVMAELVAAFGPIPAGDDAMSRGARRDWWSKANRHPRCHERYYRRYSVGYTDNILGAFHVRGEGDTWEEAFAAVRP